MGNSLRVTYILFAVVAALFSLIFIRLPRSTDPSSGVEVKVAGATVHGIRDSATPGVRQFLGIPFAKPPLGSLRFAPPRPSRLSGELNATVLPPSCMQYLSSNAGFYTREVLGYNLQGLNTTGSISEDCLKLSIWTPSAAKKGDDLPVLIFIYGGGFSTGGMDVPYQIPAQWVQRTQGHIVVSFNYRLNIFGFPSAAGLAAENQNLGLLDQRLAVEWLRNNIAEFGGDPERMGLWGQSAGALSVGYFGFAYQEDIIVNALIMDSGTEFSGGGGEPVYSNFTFVAEHVGCGGLSKKGELECMRKVDAHEIEAFLQSYQDAGTTPGVSFWPVADGKTVFANYTRQALEGKMARIPAIIGTNAQDGNPFSPYDPNGVNQRIADEFLMSTFFCPSLTSTRNRLANGLKTFRYEYFGNFTNISPKPWMGAYHSSELPMLCGTHSLYRDGSTELERETSEAMQDAWLTIVRDGISGLEGEGWFAHESEGGIVRKFGNGIAVRNGNAKELEAKCDL